MPATLTWHGREVRERTAAAAALAVNRTMAEAVHRAREHHPGYPPVSEPYTPFANRTGYLEASVMILDDASPFGPRLGGRWGSEAAYALYLEIGTSVRGPRAAERAAAADGNIALVAPPAGPLMAPRPYLRPAADIEYPLLATRIAARLRGEPMP